MASEGGGANTPYSPQQVQAGQGRLLGTNSFTSSEKVQGASNLIASGFNVLGAYQKGRMAVIQGDYQAQQAEFNAELLAVQREDILDISEDVAQERQKRIGQMLGVQKTTMAARGIEVDGELADLIASEERRIGAEDILAIKTNARKQAFGIELQEQDLKAQARFARIRGKSARKQGVVSAWSGLAQSVFSTALSAGTGA